MSAFAAVRTDTSRIRIVSVLDTWIVSGPGRQLSALSTALKPHGVDLHIVMFRRTNRPPSPFIEYLARMGVQFHVIEQNGRFDRRVAAKLDEIIAEIDPDIVNTHGYWPGTLVSLLRLRHRRARWKWVGYFHGATTENLRDKVYNKIDQFLLKRVDRLIVLSEEHRLWFTGVAKKVRLIHNAALELPGETARVDISHLRKPGRILAGVVARLSFEKGADILIDAISVLRRQGVDIDVVIAGDGSEEANLRKQSEALGIADHVHFIGRIADVMNLYRQLDVLVIPSRSGAEGLPNVLLESIRAGLPVVATRVAAVPEVLTDPHAGLVVEPGDAAKIAAAIPEAIALGKSEKAPAARAEVLHRFSLDVRVNKHLELYKEMLAK